MKKEYEKNFNRLAKKHGMSDENIDFILLRNEEDDFSEVIY
ncbi:hypothetical protein [Methanosarcina siciliae]|nr:hypothetical protein [Methanosarcina siciliae]